MLTTPVYYMEASGNLITIEIILQVLETNFH